MKQIAVKGDEYVIWEDTYKDPKYQDPPPPVPLDPEDPEKYTTPPPPYDPLYLVTPTDTPDTGDEFVFCNGKPVITVGYTFSKLKREVYRREWTIDEETGHIKEKKEEKKDSDEVDVVAVDGNTFVYIEDKLISCMEGGVSGTGKKYAVIDGQVEEVGELEATGKFTKCYGHVYFD